MPRLQQLATRLSLPIETDLTGYQPSSTFIRQFPIGYVREHQIIAFQAVGDPIIHLAISDEKAWPQLDIVSRKLQHSVRPLLAEPEQIRLAINAAYSVREGEAEQVLESIGAESFADQLTLIASREDLLDVDGRAPIIRLVNQLIFDAVVAGASDIHIQPYEGCVKVRQRIDGVLFDSFEVPKSIQEEVRNR